MEHTDNIYEQYCIKILEESTFIHSRILQFYSELRSEEVWHDDSHAICEAIFGFGATLDEWEIEQYLRQLQVKQKGLLFTLIHDFIIEVIDVKDEVFHKMLTGNDAEGVKLEVELAASYIITTANENIIGIMRRHKWIFENFSKDYLDDIELNLILDGLPFEFKNILQEWLTSTRFHEIQNNINLLVK